MEVLSVIPERVLRLGVGWVGAVAKVGRGGWTLFDAADP
jgi:hypothetical protein